MVNDIFFYCALGGGVLLLLQIVMMLLGMDEGGLADGVDGDLGLGDSDHEGSGFWLLEMISLRTVAAAATLFGLVGRAALESGQSIGVSLALAGLAGFAALYSVYWIFKQVFKLEVSGAADIRGAVGLPAQVYVPIGPGDSPGKIQIKLQGRSVEYQALCVSERLSTGSQVVVTEVLTDDTVRVSPNNHQ